MRTKHLSALIAAVAAAIMLIGAGSAAASECPRNIRGEGSSLQRLAQEVWGERFHATCTGGGTVSYAATGSGAGLSAWHAEGRAGSVAESGDDYIATDDAPESTQVTNIRNHAGSVGVAVIPVAQAAVAMIVHPPAGCGVTRIDNASLEDIWDHTITNWERISPTPTGGASCNSAITRVVRLDSSGTTFQFKHYLWLIDGAVEEGKTWLEWQGENTSWPNRASTRTPTENGGGPLVTFVERTAGTIGYANFGDATGRTNVTLLEVQNNGTVSTGQTYRNPRESGVGATGANCSGARYRDNLGTGSEVGEVSDPITLSTIWTNVYGSNPSSTTYPICTLTWDVALLNYTTGGFEVEIGKTVREYLGFAVSSALGAGQGRLAERHYGALPGPIQSAAATIAGGIS